MPDCPNRGGILKPDVVFFGENLPRDRVERSFAGVAAGKPIAAVNLGRTKVWVERRAAAWQTANASVPLIKIRSTR